jgi:hypothetical protein
MTCLWRTPLLTLGGWNLLDGDDPTMRWDTLVVSDSLVAEWVCLGTNEGEMVVKELARLIISIDETSLIPKHNTTQ